MIIVVGIVFLALSVWAVLPFPFPLGLNWGADVCNFIKGGAPVLGFFIAFLAVFIGLSDLRDKKKEQKEAALEEEEARKAAQAKTN